MTFNYIWSTINKEKKKKKSKHSLKNLAEKFEDFPCMSNIFDICSGKKLPSEQLYVQNQH